MTRLAPLALLPVLLSAPAPAAAAERTYSVTDFDRIELFGPYQVSVTSGGFSQARAIGDQAAIDRLTVEVQGRTLKVRENRSAWGGYPGATTGTVRIELGTRSVRAASVTGTGSLGIDKVRGLRVDLALSGSGRLAVADVDTDNLVLGLAGSGAITAGGRAKQMRATVQGSGDLAAELLAVDDAQLTANTAGRVVFQARRTAKVAASGAGEVRITGAAACTVTGAAAATVTCGR